MNVFANDNVIFGRMFTCVRSEMWFEGTVHQHYKNSGFREEASEQYPGPQSEPENEGKAGLMTIIYNVKCVLNWNYVVC